MAFYILDENNNKIPVTTEVLTALVNEIMCCVSGTPFKMAFVTQAKYNELEAGGLLQKNTVYEITDDTTCEDIDKALERLGNNDIAQGKRLDALEFYDLGAISEDPKSTTNSVLNKTTTAGAYHFKYNGTAYLMLVNIVVSTRQIQTIIYRNGLNDFGYFTRDISNGKTTITEDNLALKSYVNKLYQHNITCEFNLTGGYNDGVKKHRLGISILKNTPNKLTVSDVKVYLNEIYNNLLEQGSQLVGITLLPEFYLNASGRIVKDATGTTTKVISLNYSVIEYNGQIGVTLFLNTLDGGTYTMDISSITNVVDVPVQVYN